MAQRLLLSLLLISSILGCEAAPSTDSGASAEPTPGGLPGVLTRAGGAVTEEDCPAGGVEIEVGIDADLSGTLDDDEVSDTHIICNGTHGKDGKDGADGATGAAGADGLGGAS